jgi:putative hemolysin
LVVVNGILAGSEIAIVSLRKTRLQELVDQGKSSAKAVQYLRSNPERFLATVQIGITVVGAAAAAFGGSRFAEDLAPVLAQADFLAPYAEELAFGTAVAVISYLSLVLGELVPKSLALRSSERYALAIGGPLVALAALARPLVWLLTASSNVILRLFGDRTNFMEARVSADELQQMVAEAARAGTVHPHAGEIASRALDFSTLIVSDVMVPRNQVIALPANASTDELQRVLLEENHTRMPVYQGSIDNIVGYISIKDVPALAWEHQLIVLHDLIRPPFFVPEVKPAVDLLQEMRRQRLPFAIVVEEQGGLAGIVTIEDLIEELVGEIFSEHDRTVPEPIKREPDGSALVQGNVAIRDVNRELGIHLPEKGEWTTLAGLCLAIAGRIPAPGDRLTTSNSVTLEVVEASPRRVKLVRLIPAKSATAVKPRVELS